jgi:hypothetical protein
LPWPVHDNLASCQASYNIAKAAKMEKGVALNYAYVNTETRTKHTKRTQTHTHTSTHTIDCDTSMSPFRPKGLST